MNLNVLAGKNLLSSTIRLYFTALLTVGMEYIAKDEHENLWHSKYLWYFHASHHHQTTKLGYGPSKNDAEANSYITPKNRTFELNDVFAVIFSATAMVVMYWSHRPLHETHLIHDVAFGCASGISVYGTSYFVGHDLCAHERGGARLASYLKKISPIMAKCADVHSRYHHKIDRNISDDADPYGPPYGFWLGPQEAIANSKDKEIIMPNFIKGLFWVGGAISILSLL